MKRKILISTLLFLTGLITHAQDLDIKPSQQAQGILESKNAMVDHATGLFHYKVSLYEIKSGSFTLPISLDYVAKGVKVSDDHKPVGYNWTLNTGGIVTRTIRGGFADEDIHIFGMNPISNYPTASEILDVNKRSRDGETDIFTASFSGKTVNFIINIDRTIPSATRIYAVPLERTNVKIDCEMNNLEIIKWIITDEDGTIYTFAQQEWYFNVNREGIVSKNGIVEKNYISSWYITQIEPINATPIKYYYKADVNNDIKQTNVYTTQNYGRMPYMYDYGKPLIEHKFDFEKYASEYSQDITEAQNYAKGLSMELSTIHFPKIKEALYYYIDMTAPSMIELNYQILGIGANLSSVGQNTLNTINQLYDIAKVYESYGGSTINLNKARMVALFLKSAAQTIINCVAEMGTVDYKTNTRGEYSVSKSPILYRIDYKDKSIIFEYEYEYIKSIKKIDIQNNTINNISLFNNNNLREISFIDKNNVEYDKIEFDYYAISGVNWIRDHWGYKKKVNENNDEIFWPNVSIETAVDNSLKTIINSNKGKISLLYESNESQYPHGGIRIKSISYQDDLNNQGVINYTYPLDGVFCDADARNRDIITFGGFEDLVIYPCLINSSNCIINTGNNGIIYPYVIEEYVGKGYNAYLFNTVRVTTNESYPFWLNGLLLAKASYSEDKKLMSLVKNNYYSDLNYVTKNNSYFTDVSNDIKYSESKSQVFPYRYFIDEEEVEKQYRDQGTIQLAPTVSIRAYEDVYVRNVKPRVNPVLPNQKYYLKYGGKTLLKEITECKFENSVSKDISSEDFNTPVNLPINKIEYCYDDLSLTTIPTRVVKSDTKGNRYTDVKKYLASFPAPSGILADMKNKNMLSSIVKDQQLITKSGSNSTYLNSENIYEYVDYSGNYVLDRISNFKPNNPTDITVSTINNTLFEHGSSLYRKENEFKYRLKNKSCDLIYSGTINDHQSIVCDYRNDNVILVANTPHSSVDAINNKINSEKGMGIIGLEISHRSILNFMEKFKTSHTDNCSEAFHQYFSSNDWRNIFTLLMKIAYNINQITYSDIEEEIRDNLTQSKIDTLRKKLYNDINNYGPNGFTKNDIDSFYDALKYFSTNTEIPFNFSVHLNKDEFREPKENFEIKNIVSSGYKFYVLSPERYDNLTVSCTIAHSGGSSTISIPASKFFTNSLYCSDIDLVPYSNITSIIVNINKRLYSYAALVPHDAEFEATSYNTDGTIYCKFNQSGQLERYEYDAAGRVIKVYDNDNNVLKEFKYNVVL